MNKPTFAGVTDAINACYTNGIDALVRTLYRRSYRHLLRNGGGYSCTIR